MKQTPDSRERILELAGSMEEDGLSTLLRDIRGTLQERGLKPGCGQGRKLRPSRMFIVPEGVRYLDGMQLAALTRAVEEWAAQARNAHVLFSRQRARMVYLMLRHSGAKVGEVLGLDDTQDLDFKQGEVIIRSGESGDAERRVTLPKAFMAELRHFLDHPNVYKIRGQVFRMDQGFIRRKLAEQAGRAPFSKALLNPMRHSRAVELLRQGVPLPVVQRLLGHASVALTSGYCAFSEDDSKRILHHHIQNGNKVRASARNSFHGRVCEVRTGQMLSGVVLKTKSGRKVEAVITNHSADRLDIRMGRSVTAIIKAPFVMASHEPDACFSGLLNSFQATVTNIQSGGLYLEVRGALADGTIMCSLIPYAPQPSTPLEVGCAVWFSFRPMSVRLFTE